jgi:hypothetical protein
MFLSTLGVTVLCIFMANKDFRMCVCVGGGGGGGGMTRKMRRVGSRLTCVRVFVCARSKKGTDSFHGGAKCLGAAL